MKSDIAMRYVVVGLGRLFLDGTGEPPTFTVNQHRGGVGGKFIEFARIFASLLGTDAPNDDTVRRIVRGDKGLIVRTEAGRPRNPIEEAPRASRRGSSG